MNLEILNDHVASKSRSLEHPLLLIHGAACGAWVWGNMLTWFGNEGGVEKRPFSFAMATPDVPG